MRLILTLIVGALLAAGLAALGFLFVFFLSARSALDTPSALQIQIAEMGKGMYLIPADYQRRANPVTSSPETLAAARRNYNSRCSVCHGPNGDGKVATGERIFPRASDLTAARAQSKSDGALFWIVENGFPHTGMPGWKGLLSEQDIWQLVTYIRALPQGVPQVAADTPTAVALAPTTAPPTVPSTARPPTAAPSAVPSAAVPPTVAATAVPATAAPTVAAAPAATSTSAPNAAEPIATAAAVAAQAATAAAAAAAQAATIAAQPPAATIAAGAGSAVATIAVAAGVNPVTVEIDNYTYVPETLTVPVGTQVTWLNKDADAHTVTSEGDSPLIESGEFGQNATYQFTFTQPGEYAYYCVPHDYMRAKVVVR